MTIYKRIRILGFDIFCDELTGLETNNSIKTISTINAYSYEISKNDREFKQALKDSDALLPDGVGFVIAARIIHKIRIKKIAGYDAFTYFLSAAEKNSSKLFFLGSTIQNLERIKYKINNNFKNIVLDYYAPPFTDEFDKNENEVILNKISKFKPDILFVGMTAPKQEKWVFNNKDKIQVQKILCIGAVFDYYAGNKKRAPDFMIKLGLEWVYRLATDSRHMIGRYKNSPISKLLLDAIKERISMNKN